MTLEQWFSTFFGWRHASHSKIFAAHLKLQIFDKVHLKISYCCIIQILNEEESEWKWKSNREKYLASHRLRNTALESIIIRLRITYWIFWTAAKMSQKMKLILKHFVFVFICFSYFPFISKVSILTHLFSIFAILHFCNLFVNLEKKKWNMLKFWHLLNDATWPPLCIN